MSDNTLIYKCPNCDAGLLFDPDSASFKCEFCLSSFTAKELEETDAGKRAEEARQRDEEFCSHLNEYSCPSCGAHIIADENTAADFCYYCHNPVVLSGKLSGAMAPTKIVPFKYSKEEAMNIFEKFAKKKWFVPSDFKDKARIEKITGVYYPFWITDADTDSEIFAKTTRVRSYITGNYRYTETSFFNVERRANIHFEDIANSAFSEADKKMLEGILPFPYEAQQDFNMSYLTGFQAKKRDIEREALEERFKEQVANYGGAMLESTIQGYSTVKVVQNKYKILKSHWDYSLMPIWILTYKNKKGKIFTYAMNGYTGKIYGELPIDAGKVTLGTIITGILAGALGALLGGLFLL